MSKAKIIRFIVFLLTFFAAFYQAVIGNIDLELILLFLSYINYRRMEEEDED